MVKVTVGVPVFNGARFLPEALDSLLAQSYEDFELIICDNASSDATMQICRDYAARDARIRLVENAKNLGAARNFNRTFELARGDYFKWAAHDDVCAPEFLAEACAVLDNDPSIVLCHSEVQKIDESGKVIGSHDSGLPHTGSAHARERFRNLISLEHWCFDVFGLVRREVLATTPLIGAYVGSDRNLVAELALHGRFHRIPEPLFQSRDHPDRSIRLIRSDAERARWFDPEQAQRHRYWYHRRMLEYARSIHRSPLGGADRLGCYAELLRWALKYCRPLLGEWKRALLRTPAP
jgi:glycosyltransferase involved in cell wall biosynthesis